MSATPTPRPAGAGPTRPETDLFRILNGRGELVRRLPDIGDDQLVEMFRQMVRTRAFDGVALALKEAGHLPTYRSCAGLESHVALSLAIEERDWVFCAYREQGVRLSRGVEEAQELAAWAGMPFATWDPMALRITPFTPAVGSHLPHATGYGYGANLLERDEVAIAIFGDGATSTGDFHAGMNFAGVWTTPTIFYCQNNQYADSTPVAEQTAAVTLASKAQAYGFEGVRVDGADPLAVFQVVKEAVNRARSGGGPTLIESVSLARRDGETGATISEANDPLARLKSLLAHRGLLDAAAAEKWARDSRRDAEDAGKALLEAPLPSSSGASLSASNQRDTRLSEQPAVPTAGTSTGAAKPDEPVTTDGETQSMSMAQALNIALRSHMAERPEVVVMGQDIGREGGPFAVTRELSELFGRERVIDAPLGTSGIVGAALGMSLAGLRPVCELPSAGLSYGALEQIAMHVSRYRGRSGGKLEVPVVLRMPIGGGLAGHEGQIDSPEALFTHVPGALNVVCASNPIDAKGLLASALASPDPVLFLEPMAQYDAPTLRVPVTEYLIPIGQARVVREGADVTLVTYGNAVHACLRAVATLAESGIGAELVDLRSLKPWDTKTVLGSVAKTGRLLVVHEAPASAGMAAEILATVSEEAADLLESPPGRVTHPDVPWGYDKLETYSTIKAQRVIDAAHKVLEG